MWADGFFSSRSDLFTYLDQKSLAEDRNSSFLNHVFLNEMLIHAFQGHIQNQLNKKLQESQSELFETSRRRAVDKNKNHCLNPQTSVRILESFKQFKH